MILFTRSAPAFAVQIPGSDSSDTVFVIDVSGSMDDIDPYQHTRDAVRLGVDLAPDNGRVGIVAVSERVVSEFPLTDVSTSEGRTAAKAYIRTLYNDQNTNFLPGLERAVEMLGASTAAQKRVIFLGDMLEGGLNAGGPQSTAAESLGLLSDRARDIGH